MKTRYIAIGILLALSLGGCGKTSIAEQTDLEPLTVTPPSALEITEETPTITPDTYGEGDNLIFEAEGEQYPLSGKFIDYTDQYSTEEEERYKEEIKALLSEFGNTVLMVKEDSEDFSESVLPLFVENPANTTWAPNELYGILKEQEADFRFRGVEIQDIHSIDTIGSESAEYVGLSGCFLGSFHTKETEEADHLYFTAIVAHQGDVWKFCSLDLLGVFSDPDAYMYWIEGSNNSQLALIADDFQALDLYPTEENPIAGLLDQYDPEEISVFFAGDPEE